MERDLKILYEQPKPYTKTSFIKYFQPKYKLTDEDVNNLYDHYLEEYYRIHDPRNEEPKVNPKVLFEQFKQKEDNFDKAFEILKDKGPMNVEEMRKHVIVRFDVNKMKKALKDYDKLKQVKEQEIRLIVHNRIQNNLPPEKGQEVYYETYNPLNYIIISGPISKKLKENAEPYEDLIRNIISNTTKKLSKDDFLKIVIQKTEIKNTDLLKGIYGLYLDILSEIQTNNITNLFLEADLEYFKDKDINFNAAELELHLPNYMIENHPRPTNDIMINNKRYSYAAYLLKLLKKDKDKKQSEKIQIPKADLEYPFRSKKLTKKIKDINLKVYSKGLKKPNFSNEPGYYEVDLMQLKYIDGKNSGYILFMIGINTKYLFIFNLQTKSKDELNIAVTNIINKLLAKKHNIKGIKFDGEAGLNALDLPIEKFSNSSPFSNHNRIVDRVIKTFRDAMGVDYNNDLFNDFGKVRTLRKYYNETPNRSLIIDDKMYTPKELHNNQALEWQYIGQKERELIEVKRNLKRKGLLNIPIDTLLQVAVYDKNKDTHKKRQRTFDRLALFKGYKYGNAEVKFIHPEIEELQLIPLYQISPLPNDKEYIQNTFNFLLP